jgi:hypothetical protein
MNSASYNIYTLSGIQAYIKANLRLIFMQDNAPSHRSQLTARNLQIQQITYIKWPRYSLDLNLIEHV